MRKENTVNNKSDLEWMEEKRREREAMKPLRPKVGDRIEWSADNTGGEAEVVQVWHEGVNGIPSAIPRVLAKAPEWGKPVVFNSWEYSLVGDDPETVCAEQTRKHIREVENLLARFATHLRERGRVHDISKLQEPELSVFAEQSAKLKDLEYGSPAYHEALKDLGPALTHHYQSNDHHPEHFPRGVEEMDLLQLVEMYCDWCAASKRMKDGSIEQSIAINMERFGLSDQLTRILMNTAKRGYK